MKKILLFTLLYSFFVNAQDLEIDSGASITLGVGTSLNVVGLEFQTAVSDFELTGPYSITRSNSSKEINGKDGITLSFANTLMTGYKGTVVLHYEDAYLNGLSEADLLLNTQDNTNVWEEHSGTVVDVSENTLAVSFDNSSPITFKGVTGAESPTVSVEDFDIFLANIHPNPTKDKINMPGTKGITKEVYDLLGKKMLETKELVMDISHFTDGVYVLKLSDVANSISKTVKIVKK